MIDEGAKRARPDVVAANKAQPVEPFIFGSIPTTSVVKKPL
jgi:hypothetical protein